MRTFTSTYGTFVFPDKWCYAFNDNFIEVSNATLPDMIVTVSSDVKPSKFVKLTAVIFKGKAKINISRALQMMFADNVNRRCEYVHVAIGKRQAATLAFHCYVVWGHLKQSEHLPLLGNLNLGATAKIERQVVWFTHYPFTVSLFRRLASEPVTYSTGIASGVTGYNIVDVPVSSEITPTSPVFSLSHVKNGGTLQIFDKTFDNTFIEKYGALLTETITVHINPRTEGYYLRWLDCYGYLQYYLFPKGTVELKNTISSETRYADDHHHTRPLEVDLTRTMKCAAFSLPTEIYNYVSGITNANRVELYEDDMWKPVKVTTQTSYNSKKIQQDFEISIEQKITTQNLR